MRKIRIGEYKRKIKPNNLKRDIKTKKRNLSKGSEIFVPTKKFINEYKYYSNSLVLNKLDRWLDDIWQFLGCRSKKPSIVFKSLYPISQGYHFDTDVIEIDSNRWMKMLNAERKLFLIRELLCACNFSRLQFVGSGIKLSLDCVAVFLYFRIWGKDKDWNELERKIINSIKGVRK